MRSGLHLDLLKPVALPVTHTSDPLLSLSTLVIGLNPFGFLMLFYPSETGLLPVALMLFWLLP